MNSKLNLSQNVALNGFEATQSPEEPSWGLDIPQRSLSAPASHEQLRMQLEQGIMALLGESSPTGANSSKAEDCPELGLQKVMGLFGPPGLGPKSPPGLGGLNLQTSFRDYQQHAQLGPAEESVPLGGRLASATIGSPQNDDDLDATVSSDLQALREIAASGGGLSGCTTAMMQHVPSKYTQRKLMYEINRRGFLGLYDFLYLPVDSRNHANRGFAFLNFVTAEHAQAFYIAFHGERLLDFVDPSTEPLKVVPADVQGYAANVARYMASCQVRKHKRHSTPFFLQPLPANDQSPAVKDEVRANGRFLANKIKEVPEVAAVGGYNSLKAAARFCHFCGNVRVASHVFCQYCGTALLPA